MGFFVDAGISFQCFGWSYFCWLLFSGLLLDKDGPATYSIFYCIISVLPDIDDGKILVVADLVKGVIIYETHCRVD